MFIILFRVYEVKIFEAVLLVMCTDHWTKKQLGEQIVLLVQPCALSMRVTMRRRCGLMPCLLLLNKVTLKQHSLPHVCCICASKVFTCVMTLKPITITWD